MYYNTLSTATFSTATSCNVSYVNFATQKLEFGTIVWSTSSSEGPKEKWIVLGYESFDRVIVIRLHPMKMFSNQKVFHRETLMQVGQLTLEELLSCADNRIRAMAFAVFQEQNVK